MAIGWYNSDMIEKRLTAEQIGYLKSVPDILAENSEVRLEQRNLVEEQNLSPEQASQILGIVGLIFYRLLDESQKPLRARQKRQLSAKIIDNPPCSRNIADARNGFEHHHLRYSRPGRNHRRR